MGGELLEHVGRVAATIQRVQKPAVVVAVGAARGSDVGRGVCRGLDMGRVQAEARVAPAGGVIARLIPQKSAAPRFVERDPTVDALAQAPPDDVGVVGEGIGRRPRRPAAGVLERLR